MVPSYLEKKKQNPPRIAKTVKNTRYTPLLLSSKVCNQY
jgi:hypothetical protein